MIEIAVGQHRGIAALDAEDLVEKVAGGLERHRPSLRYWLIDESRLSEAELDSERNLAAALFHLEQSHGLPEVERLVRALHERLPDPEHGELRRAFAIWLCQVLLPSRLPGNPHPGGGRALGGKNDAG